MGNVEMHDLAPVRDDERKELNLSRMVNYKQYCKHLNGESLEFCVTELPWSIRDAVSLYERMDASFNYISELPVELPLRLPHLNYLNLSHNRLSTLPESFGLLFHLKVVLLSYNRLKFLPGSFTHLVKLEKLDLSYNALRELPEELGKMESLARLNVSHNKLKCLPLSFGKSDVISVVLASHNRLEMPPQSTCDEGSAATLKYLRKQIPNGVPKPVRRMVNVFPRMRGNQLQTSVPNPHSAQAQYIQSQTDTAYVASRIKTPLLPPLDASVLDPSDLRDRILGMIYGAAIGDAVGIATKHMKPDECAFHYGGDNICYSEIVRDQHRVHWKPGDWTTNFEQLALVLESVIHWAGVVDELDFAKSLLAWTCRNDAMLVSNVTIKVTNEPDFSKTPHSVAQRLVDALGEGTDAEKYADNGALARCLALGIPNFHDSEEVVGNCVRICRATHCEPRCVAAAVTLATLIALMFRGRHNTSKPAELEEMLGEAKKVGLRYLSNVDHMKEFERYMAAKDFDSVDVHEEGRESFVLKPLGAAVAALRMDTDVKSSLLKLILLGADGNTNGCITGALLGCKVGYTFLPQDWVDGIRKKQSDWLNHKINMLLDMMGIP